VVEMEKIDKIFELLEKNTLTESEKKMLEDFANSDEEIREFIRIYKSIDSSLHASGHIHPDLLSSYILFEMGDESDERLIKIIKDKIKSHLEECDICRDEYNLYANEYEEIRQHLNRSVRSDSKITSDKQKASGIFIPKFNYFKNAFAVFSVLVFGYIVLFVISNSLTPDYKTNIFADDQTKSFMTRGRTSQLFQKGLNSIDKGDYKDAVNFFKKDIEEHQNDKSIFYTYYITGITHLKAAESDFIGLFKSYDNEHVKLAIANLNESIEKNKSGDYENLKLEAYYYIGRAYLLDDKKDAAIDNLQKVIKGKGRYFKEASELIIQLEKN
jgi:tetratricopeptide (TPR) repeat protein